jgi:hypothetical protein
MISKDKSDGIREELTLRKDWSPKDSSASLS